MTKEKREEEKEEEGQARNNIYDCVNKVIRPMTICCVNMSRTMQTHDEGKKACPFREQQNTSTDRQRSRSGPKRKPIPTTSRTKDTR
jgi:hypothetical protein